jgi:hypothetical protein
MKTLLGGHREKLRDLCASVVDLFPRLGGSCAPRDESCG